MAKLFNASEETEELVKTIASEMDLDAFIAFKVLGITKQKQVVKVKKSSPIEETLGDCPGSVVVIVCEEVLEQLSEEQQRLVVKDALSCIAYDMEKDKILVSQPELCCTIGGRQKMGEDLLNALETAVLVARQIEEKKKETKAQKKGVKVGE